MYNLEIVCLLIFFCFPNDSNADENVEVSCSINAKKSLHCVSEKFLSISIDPAVLLAGVNLSENSLHLAKHINPAFIRIAGPSTQFIKYVDHDYKSENLLSDDGSCIKITPAIWFGVNEWLKLAKLTPVYGISDAETSRGLWNPKRTLPLFEISEKLNISCFWQLGYDSSEKNETRYKQDINIFHYILAAYGGRNDTWKIIGSDISTMQPDRIENIMMEESDVLEAVMWEPNGRTEEAFPEKDGAYKILLHQSAKPKTKMWTTVPKSSEPVCFSSALLWAKQVGNAAKMGFDVIFRQPRIYELFTDTPVYWFSLLHKELMGCHILDTKTTIFQEESNIFSHCTRNQNRFLRRGALTIMVVNDRSTKYKIKVKLGQSLPEKSMEVQSYILTSTYANSTDIFLNGELLTPEVFQKKNPFRPKIRRTKTSSHILLSLPPSSIGFFVLPGARLPVCIDNEKETKLLLEEIEENQNNALSEELALQLGPRTSFSTNNLLEEITKSLKNEMQHDEKYYKKAYARFDIGIPKGSNEEHLESKVDEKGRKLFIDRVKLADKHKKVIDLQKKGDSFKKFFLEKSKNHKLEPKTEQKPKNMELTSEEIEKILKDRAVERAAKKNIIFTDEELEALIRKASKSFEAPRDKRQSKVKRGVNMRLLEKYSQNNHPNSESKDSQVHHLKPRNRRSIHNIKKRVRSSRDINFDLLELKSKIADRKRVWKDKQDELLGNSNTVKESIKDKIRELKSNLRIKRDVSSGLKKIKKKKSKTNKNDEIEATIRESGQTSADILEELEHAQAVEEDDDKEEDTKGEIFAELADSEDIEADLIVNEPPKTKKLKLFEKKHKTDPFAIEHPSIDIVDHPKSRDKKKKKSKSDDKLQFLTSSEEFTDIEDDVPCIHEFYGNELKSGKKKDSSKGGIQEVNDFYDVPKLNKREASNSPPKEMTRPKRSANFTILEIAKFENNLEPEEYLQDLVMDPVLELPFLDEIYNYKTKSFERGIMNNTSTLDNIKMEDDLFGGEPKIQEEVENDSNNLDTSNILNFTENLQNLTDMNDNILENDDFNIDENDHNLNMQSNLDYNNLNSNGEFNNKNASEEESQNYNEANQDNVNTQADNPDIDIGEKDDDLEEELSQLLSPNSEKMIDNDEETEAEPSESAPRFRFKRGALIEESSELNKKKKKTTKKPIKKANKQNKKHKKDNGINENKSLSDQMNMIRDKLQERKDEIDKMIKKQKEMEHEIKEQWKNKFGKKKKISNTKKDHSHHLTDSLEDNSIGEPLHTNMVKRSIFNNKNMFGNYQPTTDLRMWKPDIYFPKKAMSNDRAILKNLFGSKPYTLKRKRRYIDTDADSIENEIDGFINEIKKEPLHFKTIENQLYKTNDGDGHIWEHKVEEVIPKPEIEYKNYFADEFTNRNIDNDDKKIQIQDTNDHVTFKSDFVDGIQKINDNKDTVVINTEKTDKFSHNNNENKDSDSSIKDGEYKFKLPNDDEFEIIKDGDETEVKFMHHEPKVVDNLEGIKDLLNISEQIFIPKITSRTVKPFEGIGQFFGQVKKLFDTLGDEIKYYFNNIGLN